MRMSRTSRQLIKEVDSSLGRLSPLYSKAEAIWGSTTNVFVVPELLSLLLSLTKRPSAANSVFHKKCCAVACAIGQKIWFRTYIRFRV